MSSASSDHYNTLGIHKSASKDDVRKAYKKLARTWHPDKHSYLKDNAEKKFKEIAEAHRVLSDDHLRHDYDKARDNEKMEREREVARRKRDDIRRMAREQEDYVRKQEEKRRKAQRMRAGYGREYRNDVANFENPEKSFKNFFEDREAWRSNVPDLFGAENRSFGRMMNDIVKMSGRMSLDGSGFTSQNFGFTDSSNINQTFDKFFSEDPFSRLKV